MKNLLENFLSAKSQQERLDLIEPLDEAALTKFNYILELRLQKECVEHFAPGLGDAFKSIRKELEKSKAFSAYKN